MRIFPYQPSMMHSKLILIDDLSLVGSLNMNKRSFRRDEEIAVTVQDRAIVKQLDRALERKLSDSVEVDARSWRQRPWSRRLLISLVRPLRRQT